VPTYDYFPFDSGLGANSMESRWRTMFQKFKTDGIIVEGTSMDISANNMAVSAGSGMAVTIVSGKAFIKGHVFVHTGTDATLAINSNTSGSTRMDLVVVRCDFVNNTTGYLVLQGTTIPVQNANQWDLPLATVAVPNNASSASSFTITDKRVMAISTSVVPTIKKSGVNFSLVNNVYTSVDLSGSTSWITHPSMYPGIDNTKIIAPQDGFYALSGKATFGDPSATPSATASRGVQFLVNGTANARVQQVYTPNMAAVLSTSPIVRLLAGDYVQFQVFHNCGSTITVPMSGMEAAVHYLGSLSV
jgi:hypothetical protein